MKKLLGLLGLLALPAVSSPIHAEDWQPIGATADNGAQVLADVDTFATFNNKGAELEHGRFRVEGGSGTIEAMVSIEECIDNKGLLIYYTNDDFSTAKHSHWERNGKTISDAFGTKLCDFAPNKGD